MQKKDKTILLWTIGIAVLLLVIIPNTGLNKKMFSMTLAITSGNLDYVKSKCGINNFYNVYQCGSYYCVDSLSGMCVDVDVNCKNAPVVYNCLNLGGGTTTTPISSGTLTCYYCGGGFVQSTSGPYTQCPEGTSTTKPVCSSVCTPDWRKALSGGCVNGVQKLFVYDANNCNVNTNKPTDTEPCASTTCTQESGTLCNTATKGLMTYSDSCQKTTLTSSGYTTDLSKCEAISPPLPPPVTPPPIVTPPPPTCPYYSPLQCGVDEDLNSSADSAGCPTSQCVKKPTSPVSPLVYVVVVSIIIVVVGVIWYFGFRTTKGKKK